MPEGPFGGPRPAARCDQELDIFFNPTNLTERNKNDIVELIENPSKSNIILRKFEEDFHLSVREMKVFKDETRIIIKTREKSISRRSMEQIAGLFLVEIGIEPDGITTHAR